MPRTRTITEYWNDYQSRPYSGDRVLLAQILPTLQVCFYAGAWAAVAELRKTDPDILEPRFDELHAEIERTLFALGAVAEE